MESEESADRCQPEGVQPSVTMDHGGYTIANNEEKGVPKTRSNRTTFSILDDVKILKEVLKTNPYLNRKIWTDISENIAVQIPKRITTRNLRERVHYLLKKFEERGSVSSVRMRLRMASAQKSDLSLQRDMLILDALDMKNKATAILGEPAAASSVKVKAPTTSQAPRLPSNNTTSSRTNFSLSSLPYLPRKPDGEAEVTSQGNSHPEKALFSRLLEEITTGNEDVRIFTTSALSRSAASTPQPTSPVLNLIEGSRSPSPDEPDNNPLSTSGRNSAVSSSLSSNLYLKEKYEVELIKAKTELLKQENEQTRLRLEGQRFESITLFNSQLLELLTSVVDKIIKK